MASIKKVVEITRNEGVLSLLERVPQHVMYNYLNPIRAQFNSESGIVTHNINGVCVFVPVKEKYQINRFYQLHNEYGLIEDMIDELRSDDVLYDIGAYLGWHSLIGLSVIHQGTIVAFEPNPKSYDRLNEVINTVVESGKVNKNIFYSFPIALSDQKGTNTIKSESGAGSTLYDTGSTGIEIPTITGDELIKREDIPTPTVVKIDVEGWETKVLRGLRDALSDSKCRIIYCEIHPHKAPEGDLVRQEVIRILKKNDFVIDELSHSSKSLIKARSN